MTRTHKIATLLALAALAPAGALAGTPPAATLAHRPSVTTVHHYDGLRVDVPRHDLATDGSGLLRNGLVPAPAEGG